jgi:glycosyltransferase involved in cell wall biosynthesis
MRIAILDMDDLKNPHWGSGQAKVTREVFKRLANQHTITVYSSKYPASIDYEADGITYKHIGLGTNNPKLNNVAYVATIPFITPSIEADVIFENFTAPFSTLFTPLFTKIPVIGITSFFSADEKGKEYSIPFNRVEKIGIKQYKYAIALNSGYLEKINQLNPNVEAKLIPNGIDDDYFKLNTKENNSILYLGRIDINQKGLDLLIESFSKIANEVREELFIVGSGNINDETRLKDMISRSGCGNKIKFLGKKTGREKLQLQSEAKVVVFPSRFEGQSLSALESIALGKPILCFDIAGFNWLKNGSCQKVSNFNTRQYSQALLDLLKNKAKRLKIGSSAKNVAKNYSWSKVANEYNSFLNAVR